MSNPHHATAAASADGRRRYERERERDGLAGHRGRRRRPACEPRQASPVLRGAARAELDIGRDEQRTQRQHDHERADGDSRQREPHRRTVQQASCESGPADDESAEEDGVQDREKGRHPYRGAARIEAGRSQRPRGQGDPADATRRHESRGDHTRERDVEAHPPGDA